MIWTTIKDGVRKNVAVFNEIKEKYLFMPSYSEVSDPDEFDSISVIIKPMSKQGISEATAILYRKVPGTSEFLLDLYDLDFLFERKEPERIIAATLPEAINKATEMIESVLADARSHLEDVEERYRDSSERNIMHSVPFYGKECNYCFSIDNEEDFDVFFVEDREDFEKNIIDMVSDHWNNVDTCVLWAAYKAFEGNERVDHWESIKIQNADAELVMELTTSDELIEAVWMTLTDVNIDENECIEQNWFVLPKGTDRETIWQWFDEKHSKAVYWLLYGFDETEWLRKHQTVAKL